MKNYLLLCLAALLLNINATSQQRIIIDSDSANEVDDVVAIARALMSDQVEVIGLTAAQWNHEGSWMRNTAEESREINDRILRIMDREDIPSLQGSEQRVGVRYESGSVFQWSMTARESEAADFIAEKALTVPEGEKLTVLVMGPLTNVASAILRTPSIAPKLSVHYIGTLYDPVLDVWNKNEFNTRNDLNALDAVLNAQDLELHIMPANATDKLRFLNKSSMDRLEGRPGICSLILERWKKMVPQPSDEWGWIMWDLALIHAIIHPEWVEKNMTTTPPENRQRPISVYTAVDHGRMIADFWKHFSCD